MLVSRRKARCGHGIREVTFNKVINLCTDINLITQTINVEVVDGKFVGINLLENRNSIEGIGDDCSKLNELMGGFMLPVIEHLTLNEGIVGHGCDWTTRSNVNEVLRLRADDVSFAVLNDKRHTNLIIEDRMQDEVFGHS